MSRYHSPYADPQPVSRLPWLFGLLIVVAIIAAGAIVVRGKLLDVTTGSSGTSTQPPTAAAQANAVATVTQVATANPTAPAGPTSTPSGDELAVAQLPSGPRVQSPAAASPPAGASSPAAPAASPTLAVANAGDSAVQVVREYAAHWSAGDYDGLYDFLSTTAQKTISRQDFIDRYKGIADRAGLTAVTMTVSGQPNLQAEVPIHVELKSSKVGTIKQDNVVPLMKENGVWRVNWTPSLIFKDLADGCVDYYPDIPKRGAILDRNGKPLAIDGTIAEVVIVPGQLTNEQQELTTLSKVIGMPPAEIKAKYDGKAKDLWWPIKDFPESKSPELIKAIANLPGVRVQNGTARVYPLGAAAAHITGYIQQVTADDLKKDPSLDPSEWLGRSGIEAAADDILRGKPGGQLVIVQCDTRQERSTIAEKKAVPAKDVILTIDADFQVQVDKDLGNVKGSAVVLDPRSGAVLAMASHPSFDPNLFVLGMTETQAQQLFDPATKPLLDRAVDVGYPTGSIFKVITMSAGMKDLGYTGDTQINCPARWSIPGTSQEFDDWVVDEGEPPQGTLTLHQALVQSCNTVFYQVGAALDKKDPNLLPDMAKAYGLGKPTGIPYLYEVGGTVPDPNWKLNTIGDYWATGDAVNLAIGQGYLQATPLQMAVVYAAIANGGEVLQPYIVAQTRDAAGGLQTVGEKKVRNKLPLTPQMIQEIQSALRDQTTEQGVGSSRVFGDFSFAIAGKTGTAQNANTPSKPHSWFAAYGPYGQTPTITSIVMAESAGEGVTVAAPITKTIYEDYLKTDLPKNEP